VRWTGGDPECSHEDREATVEGGLACWTCGALLVEAEEEGGESPGEAQQVKYVLRGTLGGVRVCGEWEDSKLAELAATGIRAHGGRATVLKVTTEEVPTGV
jgi:hypothetical protein